MSLRVSKHSNQPCSVIFVNFYNFFNNDVIMSLLVSTGNCKRLPTGVFIPPTPTRQNSFVASASAVCIGHNSDLTAGCLSITSSLRLFSAAAVCCSVLVAAAAVEHTTSTALHQPIVSKRRTTVFRLAPPDEFNGD